MWLNQFNFSDLTSSLRTTDISGYRGCSDGKESAYNVGDQGLISGSERSTGEGNGKPLQYSCLENPMNEGSWQATIHGVTKSWI